MQVQLRGIVFRRRFLEDNSNVRCSPFLVYITFTVPGPHTLYCTNICHVEYVRLLASNIYCRYLREVRRMFWGHFQYRCPMKPTGIWKAEGLPSFRNVGQKIQLGYPMKIIPVPRYILKNSRIRASQMIILSFVTKAAENQIRHRNKIFELPCHQKKFK